MTLGTITLLAITGSMPAIKLAIMILAVVLLAKALSPRRSRLARRCGREQVRLDQVCRVSGHQYVNGFAIF